MKVSLQINNKNIKVNNQTKEMDVAPFLKSDRTFVPVRFVSEAFGFDVKWDDSTNTVTISDERNMFFDTIDEAAIDWAMCYNNASIGLHKEFASTIYKVGDKYTYTKPSKGSSNNSVPTIPPNGVKEVKAVIHSHASTGMGTQKADKFSSGDINCSITYNAPIYAATPCGTLIKTCPKQIGGDGKTYTVKDNIPYDRNAYTKLISSWGYPGVQKALSEFQRYHGIYKDMDTTADYYNKLFGEDKSFPVLAD